MHPRLEGCLRVTVGTATENQTFIKALRAVIRDTTNEPSIDVEPEVGLATPGKRRSASPSTSDGSGRSELATGIELLPLTC